MNKNLKSTQKNKLLLEEICEVYGYELLIKDNEIFCIIEGGDINDEETYRYTTFEEALIDWLPTLKESEENYIREDANITWINEINYIEDLKETTSTNSNISLDDYVTYGIVPNNLRARLLSFIKKQDELSDKMISTMKLIDTKLISRKITLPVEFVLVDEILTYVKIVNESFLNRLILENDTSEIEPSEQYIYTKDGEVQMLPLIEMNRVKKFEVNIPICVALLDNGAIHIKTPLKYTDLF